MVALRIGEADQSFLQNRVPSIPEREGKAKCEVFVREPRNAILAPTVGARASLVMRQIIPGITTWTVVLPDRAPLTFAQVGSPLSPMNIVNARFLQPLVL